MGFIQVQESPSDPDAKRILLKDVICLQRVTTYVEIKGLDWNFPFELRTTTRTFVLFAATSEERDLWVNGLHRILKIKVSDINFRPMPLTTKKEIEL